jgi:hypothetical protein
MKILVLVLLVILSFNACAKEKSKVVKKTAKKAEVKEEASKTAKAEAPCDSKEDVFKKLEEKKKSEAEKGKGFSLQGGNMGCSVK